MTTRWTLLISSFIILTSCISAEAVETSEVLTFEPNLYEVVFLPGEADSDLNHLYMDAIIELKAKHPSEFSNPEKVQDTHQSLGIPENTEGPAIFIRKSGEIISTLQGPMNRDKIIEELKYTFEEI